MRFKASIKEGTASLMLLTTILYLTSSILASPIRFKSEIKLQGPEPQAEPTFVIITIDSSAAARNTNWYMFELDSDIDLAGLVKRYPSDPSGGDDDQDDDEHGSDLPDKILDTEVSVWKVECQYGDDVEQQDSDFLDHIFGTELTLWEVKCQSDSDVARGDAVGVANIVDHEVPVWKIKRQNDDSDITQQDADLLAGILNNEFPPKNIRHQNDSDSDQQDADLLAYVFDTEVPKGKAKRQEADGSAQSLADLLAITSNIEGSPRKTKRHNWALVCYDVDPDWVPGPQTDRILTSFCIQRYGYTCDANGGRASAMGSDLCDENCRCKNLFPQGVVGSICFSVAGIKKCIKAKRLELTSLPTIDEDTSTSHNPTTESKAVISDVDERESLAKRHNWAFVCYKLDPRTFAAIAELDRKRRDDCVQKNGYSCNKKGQLEADTGKNDYLCNLYCRCENFFPSLNAACAVDLLIGVKKCVSRRDVKDGIEQDLDTPGTISAPSVDPTLSAEEAGSLVQRHKYVLSCYDQDPFTNLQTTKLGTTRSRKYLQKEFSCPKNVLLTRPKSQVDTEACFNLCKCEHLYPYRNLYAACAVAVAITEPKKCVSRFGVDIASKVPTVYSSDIDTRSLKPRHNYALVCYDVSPFDWPKYAKIDTNKGKECLGKGLSCNSEGYLIATKQFDAMCDDRCKCQDLYPQSNLWKACAIKAVVAGSIKCLTKKDDLYVFADTSEVFDLVANTEVVAGDPIDLTGSATAVDAAVVEKRSLIKRHNWAFVCYTSDPDKSGLLVSIDRTFTDRCTKSPYQYGCDSQGSRRFVQADPSCKLLCRCMNLYPRPEPCLKTSFTFNLGIGCLKGRHDAVATQAVGLPESGERAGNFSNDNIEASAPSELNVTTWNSDNSVEVRKVHRRDDSVQQSTTVSQNATFAQDGNATDASSNQVKSSYYIDCQNPLLTLRCIFEVQGYDCNQWGKITSKWGVANAFVQSTPLWLQPDWRTCNCLCTCLRGPAAKRYLPYSKLRLPTPEQALDRAEERKDILLSELGTEDLQPPPGPQGPSARKGPKPKPKPKPDNLYYVSCQAFEGRDDTAAAKHCAVDESVGCSDKGAFYAEGGGAMDAGCAAHCSCSKKSKRTSLISSGSAAPFDSEYLSTSGSEDRGGYVIDCDELTEECTLTDGVGCSDRGIVHTEDNRPIDEACAMHCKCEWRTGNGKRSDSPSLHALFHADATFKPTRHEAALSRMARRQTDISNKYNRCNAFINGVISWTLMCQESPPDYLAETFKCYQEGGFWCPFSSPALSWLKDAPSYLINDCNQNCICYKRYDPPSAGIQSQNAKVLGESSQRTSAAPSAAPSAVATRTST